MKKTFKQLILSILTIVSLGLTSCSKHEKAIPDFEFEYSSTQAGTITLINKSAHADQFTWYFGDNETSVNKNPTHTYKANGKYRIDLIAKNDWKSSNKEISKFVIISDLP